MPDYDNSGRFGLWKNNERKEATHPHLTGNGEQLDGSKCWISAWFSKDLADDDKKALTEIINRYNDGASKRPFLNISIKLKQATHDAGVASAQAAVSNQPAGGDENWDDDIPF